MLPEKAAFKRRFVEQGREAPPVLIEQVKEMRAQFLRTNTAQLSELHLVSSVCSVFFDGNIKVCVF